MGEEGAARTAPVARELAVPCAVYSLDTVKKAAYRFIGRANIEFALRGEEIVCKLTFPRGASEVTADAVIQDFKSELLDQDLRHTVAEETAPIRNAILALAFAPTKHPGRG